MTTYREKHKAKPFDWNEFLNQKSGQITNKEWSIAKRKAQSWVTCACGNQCDIIPRYGNGRPMDNKLYDLGLTFYDHIKSKNNKEAKKTLKKIEKRSNTLIKELENKSLKILRALGYSKFQY